MLQVFAFALDWPGNLPFRGRIIELYAIGGHLSSIFRLYPQ